MVQINKMLAVFKKKHAQGKKAGINTRNTTKQEKREATEEK